MAREPMRQTTINVKPAAPKRMPAGRPAARRPQARVAPAPKRPMTAKRPMAAGKPGPAPKRRVVVRRGPVPTSTKGGRSYASADARMRALFQRQKEEARKAAIFLSGLANLGAAPGAEGLLSDADRKALAAKYEKVTGAAAAIIQGVESNKSFFSTEDATALDTAKRQYEAVMADVRGIVRSGYYGSQAITTKNVSAIVKSVNKALADALTAYAAAVEKYNKGGTAAWAGRAASGLKDVAGSLGSALATPFRILKWALIGVAAIFILPPIIRIVQAGRSGGAGAAMDATASEAERAQSSVISAAKKGAGAAATLAIPGSPMVRGAMAARSMAGFGRYTGGRS